MLPNGPCVFSTDPVISIKLRRLRWDNRMISVINAAGSRMEADWILVSINYPHGKEILRIRARVLRHRLGPQTSPWILDVGKCFRTKRLCSIAIVSEIAEPSGNLICWFLKLAEYSFEVIYTKGKKKASRNFLENEQRGYKLSWKTIRISQNFKVKGSY